MLCYLTIRKGKKILFIGYKNNSKSSKSFSLSLFLDDAGNAAGRSDFVGHGVLQRAH